MINIQGISLTFNFPYFLKITFKLYFLYLQFFYERFNKTISFILNFFKYILSSITCKSSINLTVYCIIVILYDIYYSITYKLYGIINNKVPAYIICSAPLTTPGAPWCGNYIESRWTVTVRILPTHSL